MGNCKECYHYEVCRMHYQQKCELTYETEKEVRHAMLEAEKGSPICEHFKDRSQFVKPPCKVGDTVYWNILGKPVEDEITNITIYDNCTRVFLKKGISFDIEDIGRIIFLSREKALEE